jgi:hypothetical protein
MIEARCQTCDETFNPIDENDTEHLEKLDGTECGGQGIIIGRSVEALPM